MPHELYNSLGVTAPEDNDTTKLLLALLAGGGLFAGGGLLMKALRAGGQASKHSRLARAAGGSGRANEQRMTKERNRAVGAMDEIYPTVPVTPDTTGGLHVTISDERGKGLAGQYVPAIRGAVDRAVDARDAARVAYGWEAEELMAARRARQRSTALALLGALGLVGGAGAYAGAKRREAMPVEEGGVPEVGWMEAMMNMSRAQREVRRRQEMIEQGLEP